MTFKKVAFSRKGVSKRHSHINQNGPGHLFECTRFALDERDEKLHWIKIVYFVVDFPRNCTSADLFHMWMWQREL